MLRFLLQSIQSPSRRRKQAGRCVAVPAQVMEHKQMLSGVQPTVDSPNSQQTNDAAASADNAPASTTNLTSAVTRWNSGMFSRQPTVALPRVNTAWGTRPVVPAMSRFPHLSPRATPGAVPAATSPVVASTAFSRSATQTPAVRTPSVTALRPVQPITPPATHPTPSDDHGQTTTSATKVVSPSTTDGRLHRGDSDWFQLEVKKGQTYTISVKLKTLADSTLRIRNAQSVSLKFDDNGGLGRGSKLTWTATEDATIYLDVQAKTGSQTGTYELYVSNEDSAGGNTQLTTPAVPTRRIVWWTRRIYFFRT